MTAPVARPVEHLPRQAQAASNLARTLLVHLQAGCQLAQVVWRPGCGRLVQQSSCTMSAELQSSASDLSDLVLDQMKRPTAGLMPLQRSPKICLETRGGSATFHNLGAHAMNQAVRTSGLES